MNLGTDMPDGERRKPIDIEVCRSKVKVTLSIHMFATRLSHLWCVTDFYAPVFKTGCIMVYQCLTVRPSVSFTCRALT